MKIETLKDLEKFIALCRKHGITDVKIDGMEFHLGPVAPKTPRRKSEITSQDPLATAQITIPKFGGPPDETPEQAREKYNKRKSRQKQGISEQAPDIATPDDLSEEEMLFWSAGGPPQQAEDQQ